MIKILKKLLYGNANKAKYDFSSFFLYADQKTKMRVLEGVAKKANEDQKALMERHEKLLGNNL